MMIGVPDIASSVKFRKRFLRVQEESVVFDMISVSRRHVFCATRRFNDSLLEIKNPTPLDVFGLGLPIYL